MKLLQKAEQAMQEAAKRYAFDESPKALHALRLTAIDYARALKAESKRWHRDAETSYTFDDDATTIGGAS